MLPYLFFACLIILICLSLKSFLNNPARKLNIYLALIPGIFIFSTIIEIILYYDTDEQHAYYLFWVYQELGCGAITFLLLSIIENIKIYTRDYNTKVLSIIRKGVIYSNLALAIFILFHGPTAKIFLTKANMWDLDLSASKYLFYCHIYFNIFCLVLAKVGFMYLACKADSGKKKCIFVFLAFCEFILLSGIILIILPNKASDNPQYYFIASLPGTLAVLFNVWVLSDFSIFKIPAKNIYEDVITATNNWVLVLDENGKIKFVNNIVVAKSNFAVSTLYNMNIADLFEVLDGAGKNETKNLNLEQFRHTFSDITLRFKNASIWFNLQLNIKKIILPDNIEAYLCVFIDPEKIDVLISSKAVIEADKEKLNKTHDDLSFIMNMTSHDLKAPLQTIIELVDLIKIESKLTGENRSEEYLNYITSISNQSLQLTSQMIEYMRIGVVDKKMVWSNFHSLLDDVKERLFVQIEKSHAQIDYKGLVNIYGDARQIKELLVNFVDNAIKYRSIADPIIQIEVLEEELQYQFTIKDNGLGIDDKLLPKIFTPSFKKEKRLLPGSGIGLYLCKTIIEANNGVINIQNNLPENGITINFNISKGLVND